MVMMSVAGCARYQFNKSLICFQLIKHQTYTTLQPLLAGQHTARTGGDDLLYMTAASKSSHTFHLIYIYNWQNSTRVTNKYNMDECKCGIWTSNYTCSHYHLCYYNSNTTLVVITICVTIVWSCTLVSQTIRQ